MRLKANQVNRVLAQDEGTLMLTDADFKAIKARARAATPGPWTTDRMLTAGVYDGTETWRPASIAIGQCAFCWNPDATLLADRVDEKGWHHHVHRIPMGDWHDISSLSTFEPITGNYDDEEGGICSTEEDAEFIVHSREDMEALVADHEMLRAFVRKVAQVHWDALEYQWDGVEEVVDEARHISRQAHGDDVTQAPAQS